MPGYGPESAQTGFKVMTLCSEVEHLDLRSLKWFELNSLYMVVYTSTELRGAHYDSMSNL